MKKSPKMGYLKIPCWRREKKWGRMKKAYRNFGVAFKSKYLGYWGSRGTRECQKERKKFREIIAENFPNLEDTNKEVWEGQRLPVRFISIKSTSGTRGWPSVSSCSHLRGHLPGQKRVARGLASPKKTLAARSTVRRKAILQKWRRDKVLSRKMKAGKATATRPVLQERLSQPFKLKERVVSEQEDSTGRCELAGETPCEWMQDVHTERRCEPRRPNSPR